MWAPSKPILALPSPYTGERPHEVQGCGQTRHEALLCPRGTWAHVPAPKGQAPGLPPLLFCPTPLRVSSLAGSSTSDLREGQGHTEKPTWKQKEEANYRKKNLHWDLSAVAVTLTATEVSLSKKKDKQ